MRQVQATLDFFALFVYQAKVVKGGETLTAFFRETIPKWPSSTRWYSGES